LVGVVVVAVVLLLHLFHVKNTRKKGSIVVIVGCFGMKFEAAECG